MGIRVANKIRSTRQTRQPTVSAAKTKQRYKKRRNCKHKKSGCVCFIVRARAQPLCGIGASGPTRPCAQRPIQLQSYEPAQNCARMIATKSEYFFSIRTFHQSKRGAKERDFPIITANKGTFHHLPPTPLGAETICLLLPHHSHAYAPTCMYAPSTVFR